VRLAVHRPGRSPPEAEEIGGAMAELQLGDAARIFPSDAALAGWRAQADQGKSAIVYD
jgi:DNA polymerase III subunit alpha